MESGGSGFIILVVAGMLVWMLISMILLFKNYVRGKRRWPA